MKRVRWLVCIAFVISCVVFGVYVAKEKLSKDTTAPTISCAEGILTVSVKATNEELLQGVTAQDEQDGDLTADIRIASMSHINKQKERTVKFVVFDRANNAATGERTIAYRDYSAPRIYLSEALRYDVVNFVAQDVLKTVTAKDCLDGDVSSQVKVSLSSGLYNQEEGNHAVVLMVSNSAGDICSLEMDAVLVDKTDSGEKAKFYPVLSDYIVYTKIGGSLDFAGYVRGLENNGQRYLFGENAGFSASDVVIQSKADFSKVGVYPVTYSYTTPEGIKATTTLYVVVEE